MNECVVILRISSIPEGVGVLELARQLHGEDLYSYDGDMKRFVGRVDRVVDVVEVK